jgi:hypothetical protein
MRPISLAHLITAPAPARLELPGEPRAGVRVAWATLLAALATLIVLGLWIIR